MPRTDCAKCSSTGENDLRGRSQQGSEGQKLMSAGMPLPTFFRKNEGCSHLGSVRLIGGIW